VDSAGVSVDWLKAAGAVLGIIGSLLVAYVIYLCDKTPKKHKHLEVK
jgi:hypothetical protein